MKYKILTVLSKYIIWIVILFIIIFSSIFINVFLTVGNLSNILRQISILGILSIGVTFVFIGGSFDLSIGSILMFCTIIVIDLQPTTVIKTIIAIIAAMMLGILLGSLNGFLIGYLKGNAFIVTLGTQGLILGIALFYTGGQHVWVREPSKFFSFISEGEIFKIPFPMIIFLLLIIILNFILRNIPFGKRLYAIGNSEMVAKVSGINVSKIRFSTFIISGLFAGIGGVVLGSRALNITPTIGRGYEFDAITALVLGGVSLFGGKGNMVQTLSGVLLIGVLHNSLTLIGVSTTLQMVITGLLLIFAVYLDVLTRSISKSR